MSSYFEQSEKVSKEFLSRLNGLKDTDQIPLVLLLNVEGTNFQSDHRLSGTERAQAIAENMAKANKVFEQLQQELALLDVMVNEKPGSLLSVSVTVSKSVVFQIMQLETISSIMESQRVHLAN